MPAIKLLFIPILAVALATASAASDDADRDGVVDRLDECPTSEAGAPVTMRGCAYDTDADGIPDYRDDCQHSSGATVDSYGCGLVREIELPGLAFESNSATITRSSHSALDAAVATLQRYRNLVAEVAGHTDDVGSAAHNRRLSRRRAEAVRAYLVAAGIDAAAVRARGYGESRPVASNDSEDGRARNRRVVIRITSGTEE